jgi:hypothetical protein
VRPCPNSSIHVSESELYVPKIGLIWNLQFPELLVNRRSREKGRELPPSRGWRKFPALPSAHAVEPRAHINDQHTNFQFGKYGHKWKQLILVVNFLFGLRGNEIPNKTFILDWPSICSVLDLKCIYQVLNLFSQRSPIWALKILKGVDKSE